MIGTSIATINKLTPPQRLWARDRSKWIDNYLLLLWKRTWSTQ